MAKASLVLPDGTKVTIEGTAEEVAVLLAKCSSSTPVESTPKTQQKSKKKRDSSRTSSAPKRARSKGPVGLITELAADDFFKTKRMLPEVQKKLEEGGHIYAQSSLSPAVLSLTKKKILRRLKEKQGWAYVRGSAEIE